MADEPQGGRQVTRPLTLRITSAEVLESQLQEEDLRALEATARAEGTCGGTYCETSYTPEAEL
jgi:hypothetical protein